MFRMPLHHCQEQHEAMPGVSMREYLAMFLRRLRHESLPPMEHREGTVYAVLNHGLWVGRCPQSYCGGEVLVTSTWPHMVCTDCGSGWYDVEFPTPKMKLAIVAEVEKRPTNRLEMPYANWLPGETLSKLRRETLAGRDVD